ncbi:MAG UNVERIFIED_CONTAM: hypothetical protein LVQ98_01295 [Rickettsiaceae bacterium]|jgi:RNA polymerase primary sigma factor
MNNKKTPKNSKNKKSSNDNDQNALGLEEGTNKDFVTYDEINNPVPNDSKLSIDDLESAIAKFTDAGIDIIEEDDDNDDIKLDIHIEDDIRFAPAATEAGFEEEVAETEEISATDDPVRLYLRDMGGRVTFA